jgi:hypothetical protein
MSRIPAREALIASGTVSAVVSLCIVGAIAASASAAPENPENSRSASTATDLVVDSTNAPYSPLVAQSTDPAGDRQLVGGSYQGVWFDLPQPSDDPSPLASTPAPAASPAATQPAPKPAAPKASPTVRQQSRSSVQAAISGGDPRDMARALAATYSWTGKQWTCLDKLWDHESKYETTVRNPTSGAYGIPQALPASKMAKAGSDWRTNPVTQIVWGLGYIQDRYGSPCDAWSYWLRHSSY